MNLIKYEPATGNHRQIFKSFHNLTEEDIRGLHIHHLIHRSNGGGDYWWNLVAYTPELHSYVHGDDGFTSCANQGGELAYQTKKGIHDPQYFKDGSKSEWSRMGGLAPHIYSDIGKQNLKNNGKKQGLRNAELGIGFHTFEHRSNGGKQGTKTQIKKKIGIHGLSKKERIKKAKKAVQVMIDNLTDFNHQRKLFFNKLKNNKKINEKVKELFLSYHTWVNLKTGEEITFNKYTTLKEVAYVLSFLGPNIKASDLKYHVYGRTMNYKNLWKIKEVAHG